MKTIDITPTWTSLLSLYLEVYENSNMEGRREAAAELRRMANLADKYVELKKRMKGE